MVKKRYRKDLRLFGTFFCCTKKRFVLALVVLILFSSLVLGAVGKEEHIKLLAVREDNGEYKGNIADLYLELKRGSGRVFLATFPLTKMDTQISTRFAKDIACDYFNLDCENYDFMYTIKAESNIIGGPSAGAAIAVLTVISLLDLEYDDTIAITGTINSGGIVGPVGGVKEKIEAAAENNISKVLVAKGMAGLEEEELINIKDELEVSEAEDLNEVLFQFTGLKLKEDNVSVEISPDYQKIMEELASLLCNRTEKLEKELEEFEFEENETQEIEEKKNNSITSLEKEDHYSTASFCFGANILISELIYDKEKRDMLWMTDEINELREKVKLLEEDLEKEEIETISDLQARMVVKERLNEVKERIDSFRESEDKQYSLAYAEERYFSAVSWMYFFEMEGKSFVFDEEKLRESCMKKISESEERYQYAALLFGSTVEYIKEKVDKAKQNLEAKEYELCLMQAIQAKSDANAILSTMGLEEENFMDFLESKRKAAEKVIAGSGEEGVFPILGYSYYQYANSLRDSEKYLSSLYLEYALEMSGLDIYFEEKKSMVKDLIERSKKWELNHERSRFIEGFVLGMLVVLLIILGRRVFKRDEEFRKKGGYKTKKKLSN